MKNLPHHVDFYDHIKRKVKIIIKGKETGICAIIHPCVYGCVLISAFNTKQTGRKVHC